MNIDYEMIRRAMWDKKISISMLARDINISTASLSRKLSAKTEFTVSEAEKLCARLSISPTDVFFASAVPNAQRD